MSTYDWQPLRTVVGMSSASPVFPVSDLDAAIRFYVQLGFEVTRRDASYAYADREGVHIHLRANRDLDPVPARSEIYVDTAAVDELHAEWMALDLMPIQTIVTPDIRAELRRRRAAGETIGTITSQVSEKLSGAREFSVRDPDGNELRFGRGAVTGRGRAAA